MKTELKTCKSCGEDKPLDSFPPYRSQRGRGKRGTCRLCCNSPVPKEQTAQSTVPLNSQLFTDAHARIAYPMA